MALISTAVIVGVGSLGYNLGVDTGPESLHGWDAAVFVVVFFMLSTLGFGAAFFIIIRSLEWSVGESFIPEGWARWFKKTFKRKAEATATLHTGGPIISDGTRAILRASTASYVSSMSAAASLTASLATPHSSISEEFGGRGFAAGSVKGARSWNIDKLGRLIGVTYPQVWVPGENHAACRKTDPFSIRYTVNPSTMKIERDSSEDRPTPDHGMDTCGHGFYGYYEGSNDYGSEARVSGVVEAYGETVIGTRGFRAMKARILALTFGDDVTEAQRKLVARNYPDAVIYETFDAMVAAVPPDAGGQEYGPDADPEFWVREA